MTLDCCKTIWCFCPWRLYTTKHWVAVLCIYTMGKTINNSRFLYSIIQSFPFWWIPTCVFHLHQGIIWHKQPSIREKAYCVRGCHYESPSHCPEWGSRGHISDIQSCHSSKLPLVLPTYFKEYDKNNPQLQKKTRCVWNYNLWSLSLPRKAVSKQLNFRYRNISISIKFQQFLALIFQVINYVKQPPIAQKPCCVQSYFSEGPHCPEWGSSGHISDIQSCHSSKIPLVLSTYSKGYDKNNSQLQKKHVVCKAAIPRALITQNEFPVVVF